MTTTTNTGTELDNVTVGFGIASVIAIVFNAVLTIFKELYPPLLAFMKSVSILGVKHHWLVHGLAVIVLFYLLGWLFSKKESFSKINGTTLTKTIAWAAVVSWLAITVFFLIELFQ